MYSQYYESASADSGGRVGQTTHQGQPVTYMTGLFTLEHSVSLGYSAQVYRVLLQNVYNL
jgi:hypothetical protein